jgi:Na+-transporting NADH:ubiquinone oxidoreductase subunit C
VHSTRHTVVFTLLLCVVFSLAVSMVSVALRDRQEENRRLHRIRNVLEVAGLIEPGERLSREDLQRRFEANLEPRIVDLETGRYAEGVDPMAFDPRRAASDPARSRPAPPNPARVRRIPNRALVFLMAPRGGFEGVILPVEGYGLWSTMHGYLALEADARTIRGLTIYEHGETAGLGGEVDNPRWKALWPGRLALDEEGEPRIAVVKGRAGPPAEDPYHVDGISGATLTSNGVTNLLHFWLGDHGFGPYLAQLRRRSHSGAAVGESG